MVSLDKIYHAAFILKQVARRTDLIYAPNLGRDCSLHLKTENLQLTGSFKLRGAYYKISQLSEAQRKAGIIACSAGNHAQGVALAASRMGIRSVVCWSGENNCPYIIPIVEDATDDTKEPPGDNRCP